MTHDELHPLPGLGLAHKHLSLLDLVTGSTVETHILEKYTGFISCVFLAGHPHTAFITSIVAWTPGSEVLMLVERPADAQLVAPPGKPGLLGGTHILRMENMPDKSVPFYALPDSFPVVPS